MRGCFATGAFSTQVRLSIVIGLSTTFALSELAVGFTTNSLALVADAFHGVGDIVSFVVALFAERYSCSDRNLEGSYNKLPTLAAFFNSVFLVALGLGICLQGVERFIHLEAISEPKLVLLMGCIGLFLNIVSVLVLGLPGHFQLPPTDGHHAHSEGEKQALPEPDVEALKKQSMIGTSLSIKAVLLHIAADAMNNLAVIISDLLMWDSEPQVHDEMESRSTLDPRFYIDPACTLFIAILIMVTTWPLVIRSGKELLRTSETKSIPITIEETDLEKSK